MQAAAAVLVLVEAGNGVAPHTGCLTRRLGHQFGNGMGIGTLAVRGAAVVSFSVLQRLINLPLFPFAHDKYVDDYLVVDHFVNQTIAS